MISNASLQHLWPEISSNGECQTTKSADPRLKIDPLKPDAFVKANIDPQQYIKNLTKVFSARIEKI